MSRKKNQDGLIQRDSLTRLWKRNVAAHRQYRYNRSFVSEFDRRNRYLKGLIHAKGCFQIGQPFYCRYGSHITIGRNFTCGHGAIFEDEGNITIGSHVEMGNSVRLITTRLLKDPQLRQSHKESVANIVIEDHVWIGNDVTILPGVTLGAYAIIHDGSVVSEDVERGGVVAGNPAASREAESELLKVLIADADQDKKPSRWQRALSQVDMEKVDRAIHWTAFALGAYYACHATSELVKKQALLEEKKNKLEKLLPMWKQTLPKQKKRICKLLKKY